jgi:hypothetical protein
LVEHAYSMTWPAWRRTVRARPERTGRTALVRGEPAKLAHGTDAPLVEQGFRLGPMPGVTRMRRGSRKGLDPFRLYDGQAVGLLEVRGDFGYELVGPEAHGAAESVDGIVLSTPALATLPPGTVTGSRGIIGPTVARVFRRQQSARDRCCPMASTPRPSAECPIECSDHAWSDATPNVDGEAR